MNLKLFYTAFCALFICITLSAQSKLNIKFGDVKAEDFSPKSPVIDSSSNAVVLMDVGSTDFEGSSKGDFTLNFKQHERILLKSRNAFDEATIKVTLYNGLAQYAERFENLEASTFNYENGHVTETKIDKSAIFKEKYNKDYISLKFTLPNLKEGSIIEYSYTIKTPFARSDIRSWRFQREYPVLWSEYKVTIPPLYNYITIREGYLPYAIDSAGKIFKTYNIIEAGDATESSTVYNISGDAKWGWWVMKDAPAFKSQNYMSSPKNYISKIKFQLRSIRYSDTHIVQVMKSWFTTADDLLKDEDFGLSLSDNNSWMKDDLKAIVGNSKGYEKATKIFQNVRDNYTCTNDDARYLSQPIKKTFQTKKGNVVDINMLLTAMLINQDFDAHPVLLSTRDNGRANEAEAILNQYNYVISRVKIDSSYYLLDASVSRLGFGKLTENCYNGSGRLIDKFPALVMLSTDSLSETKNTFLFIVNSEKGDSIEGSLTSNLGYFESLEMREKLAKTKQEDVIKEISKAYSSDVEVSNVTLDSVKSYNDPITVKHDFKMKFDEDIVYFNPMFNEAWKNNPFASEKRIYPVEMSHKMDEILTLSMEMPKGYKIDELPKSTRLKLNEDEGMFEYLVGVNGDQIQLRARLAINKTNFMPDDYQSLRDFFAFVVKKEAEQIVFKKIK